jgi:hypothetical protein
LTDSLYFPANVQLENEGKNPENDHPDQFQSWKDAAWDLKNLHILKEY